MLPTLLVECHTALATQSLQPLATLLHVAAAAFVCVAQMSYSNNAILIGASPSCSTGDTSQHLATLYVLPKDAVLKSAKNPHTNSTATTIPRVQAAIYFAHRSWYVL